MTDGVRLRFEVLGPLRGWRGEDELDLSWPKQRVVLAALLLAAGRVVSRDELVDIVWGDDPPPSSASLVHTYLGRLRRILDPDWPQRDRQAGPRPADRILVGSRSGYLLRLSSDGLDLAVFGTHLEHARQRMAGGDLPGAVDEFDTALRLWGGRPLAGVAGGWVAAQRVRLGELRLAAVEDRAEAALRLGRHVDLVAEMTALAAEYPLRERLRALLMIALYRGGRPAEALAGYAEARRQLVEELGIEPGARLQRLQHVILTNADDDLVTGDLVNGGAGDRTDGPDLGHPDLRGSGMVVPRQLPPAVRRFVGRAAELDSLSRLAEMTSEQAGQSGGATVVISAIDGTAGIGKTALALHAAHRVADRFPDGQLYVDLRGFDPDRPPVQPEEAIRGLLDAFEVAPQRIPAGQQAQAGLYRSLLAGRRVLVVLDNARDVDQVRPLLPGSPTVLVLVTSRNQLAGLVALDGAYPLTLDLLAADEARDLLIRHLGAARVAAEPQAVDDIITSSARLPLALSIIAARAATHLTFPLAALADELATGQTRLDALDGGHPASDVRAVFSWSYRNLRADAGRLFRLLGLHCGPDTTAPAAASLLAVPVAQARQLLTELAHAHLLTEHRPGRYICHDLLRAYATELAHSHDSDSERRAAVHRGLDHYLHTAHAAAVLLSQRDSITPRLYQPGVTPERLADLGQAMAWFTAEHQVLLAAVRQAADTGFDTHAWELAWALRNFLERQGHWRDRDATQRAALDAARRLADRPKQAHAHRLLASAYLRLDRFEDAHTELRHAVELFRALADDAGQAHTHHGIAQVFERQGDFRAALRHASLARDLYRTAGERTGEANALNGIGWCHTLLGDHRQALVHCRQALTQLQELGDVHGQASTWDSLGYAHHHLGDHVQADACYRHAINLYRDLGDRYNEAATLANLGDTHYAASDRVAASAAWRSAQTIFDRLDHPDAEAVAAKLHRLAPVLLPTTQ